MAAFSAHAAGIRDSGSGIRDGDASAGPSWECSGRAVAVALVAVGVLALASRSLPDVAWADSLKIIGGSLLVTLVPGGLVMLAWRPRTRVSILELMALGIAVGFGLGEVLTVAAMLFHVGPWTALATLCAIASVHAFVGIASGMHVTVEVRRGELLLGAGVLLVAVFAYLQGSPFSDAEDLVHIAIVRRLASLQQPALNNIYYAPGIVYTYPFPGTHYLMALMSRAVALDPLFVYHKLRAFWFVVSMLTLYGLALAVFEARTLALASALVALLFVANGTFAAVSGFFWGQLVPFSHAADVAMGVLLPAVMLLGVSFIKARERREQMFFLASAMALAFMLMVVHTREIVQVIVYLASFSVALTVLGDSRRWRRRVVVLLVTTAAALVTYAQWHSSVSPMVSSLVAARRQELIDILHGASWSQLLARPLPLLAQYMQAFAPMFYGWNPILLLAAPAVLYRYRERRLVLLIGASIVLYLLIIRVPLLAIAYVWGTYFEILFTPVRNVMLFVYLLAGVAVYALASQLARWRWSVGIPAALAVATAGVFAYRFGGAFLAQWNDLFFVPALVAYAVVAFRIYRERRTSNSDPRPPTPDPGSRHTAILAALIIVPMAVFTRLPDNSPLGADVGESMNTPAVAFAEYECRDRGEVDVPFRPPELESARILIPSRRSCPPSPAVRQFATEHLPPTAVFAVDKFSMFPAPVFMPQQVVAWQSSQEEFLDEDRLFRDYYRYYRVSMLQHRVQPFFNDQESERDRMDFLTRLKVTHVLVDPWNYEMMTRVLGESPGLFRRVFDEGMWAIYEVTRSR